MDEVTQWLMQFGTSVYGICVLFFWAVMAFGIWWTVKKENETYQVGTLVAMLIVSLIPVLNVIVGICCAIPHLSRLMNVTVFGRRHNHTEG